MEFSSGTFVMIASKEYMCKSFAFKTPFKSADLPNAHVQTAIFNDDKSFTYEATVSWIEQITENGFTACIETAGPVPITRTVKLNWMAYAGSPKGGLAGSFTVPLFTTGTECVDIDILGKVSNPEHGISFLNSIVFSKVEIFARRHFRFARRHFRCRAEF